MKKDSGELHDAAWDVANAFRAGLLEHIRSPAWKDTWLNLVAELKRRCPGYQENEYDRALNTGFFETR